jgi:peptidase E
MNINPLLSSSIPRLILIGGGRMRLKETIPVDQWILKQTGKKQPKVVFLPTASNDNKDYIQCFHDTYSTLGSTVETIQLTTRTYTHKELESIIFSSDVFYMGGGDPLLLQELIHKYKLIPLLRNASKNGTIISGLSAGAAIFGSEYINFERQGNRLIHPSLITGENILKKCCVLTHYTKPLQDSEKLFSPLSGDVSILALGINAAIFKNGITHQIFKKSQYSKIGFLNHSGNFTAFKRYV